MNTDIVLGFAFGMLFGAMAMHIIWLRAFLQESMQRLNSFEAKTQETEIVASTLQRQVYVHSVQLHGLEQSLLGRSRDTPLN